MLGNQLREEEREEEMEGRNGVEEGEKKTVYKKKNRVA